MARKKRWWPATITQQMLWFRNYPLALYRNRVALEATVDEIAQAQNDAAMFKYVHEYYTAVINHAKVVLTYMEGILKGKSQKDMGSFPVFTMVAVPALVLGGMLARTFKFVINLKSRNGYNTVIGKALKVIGDEPAVFVTDNFVANGKGNAIEEGILITFKKGKNIHGMGIFCQRGESKYFEEIFRATKSGWVDMRPNLKEGVPEVRTYHTRAFINNDFIGNYSPDFSVTWLSPAIPKGKTVEGQ